MSAEEKKTLTKETQELTKMRIIKFVISLVIMLPYFFIGFVEAYNSEIYILKKVVQFDENFKFNMFIMGLVGLAFNFYPEVRLILSHIIPSRTIQVNENQNNLNQ